MQPLWPWLQPEWAICRNLVPWHHRHHIVGRPYLDELHLRIETDNDFGFATEGWVTLGWGCCAADEIVPKEIAKSQGRHSEEMFDSRLVGADVEYVADTVEDTPW